MLHRTPRETLASLSLREFRAYSKLGADRSDEYDEADEDVVDVSEMETGEIASMFGAEIV